MLWKMAFITLATFLIGAGLHVLASSAHACVCAYDGSIEGEVERADAVFRGKVTSIDSQDIVDADARHKDWVEDIVEFNVSEIWKGELHETIYVKSKWPRDYPPLMKTSCGTLPFISKRRGISRVCS